jgi:hypothetical protein
MYARAGDAAAARALLHTRLDGFGWFLGDQSQTTKRIRFGCGIKHALQICGGGQ